MKDIRSDHEFAKCTEKWGWKYNHMGVPTEEKMPDEMIYVSHLKVYVSGFPTSPFGIEWMRFDADCNIHAFNLHPGYRNIFENIIVRGSTVIMQGYSICSNEILNNIHAIWVAEIIKNKVGSWHIYSDTKANRELFDL
ncbi:MAG: hypothetical protein LBV74_09500 [Tannerella sp.]|jgi:hypothetical protein|nr:hypothetical protein [Tannerella sp.]